MKRVVIVDENDNPLGLKSYDEVRYEDIYRVSGLWLTDRATGEILLAQRKWTKKNDPGKWSCAAAGTIEEGETYEQNILHEAQEEISLSGLDFRPGPKQYVDDGKHKYFCQWFYAEVDKTAVDIKTQEEEVEGVKWVTLQELVEDVKLRPEVYTPSTADSLRLLLN